MKQVDALTLLKMGKNVFLTGAPGSGKTYVLNRYIRYLREHQVKVAVTASTGLAATHLQGVTIHSWSGIGIKEHLHEKDLAYLAKKKLIKDHYQKTKVLMIDEISMLHAYQLDMIDKIARHFLKPHEPFGGLQVIVCGDFFQLPPVASRTSKTVRFAFEAEAWKQGQFQVCYLTEQHRQGSDPLLDILESIRSGEAGEQAKVPLRRRYKKEPVGATQATRLYARNVNVDEINARALESIRGKSKIFEMSTEGVDILVDHLKKSCIAPEVLTLKVDAQVMFIKNDSRGRYVNGTRGVVVGFDKEEGWPRVKTHDRQMILAEPEAWIYEENDRVHARITQVPLRLAWAITIHKSQGMTLDTAEIDLGDVFEWGMGYVALSRVRALEGLKLMGFNELALKVNPKILEQDVIFKEHSAMALQSLETLSETVIEQHQQKTLLERFEGCAKKTDPLHGFTKKKQPFKNKNDQTSTQFITLELLKQHQTIDAIAEQRELSVNTIIKHIERLADLKQLDSELLDALKVQIPDADFERIMAELRHSEEGRLKPIYEKWEGRYSYADLRIVRLFLTREGTDAIHF